MKLRFSFLALHVFLPILAGGLTYVCWRDPDLFMFRWFGAVGLGTLVNDLRGAVAGAHLLEDLPDMELDGALAQVQGPGDGRVGRNLSAASLAGAHLHDVGG